MSKLIIGIILGGIGGFFLEGHLAGTKIQRLEKRVSEQNIQLLGGNQSEYKN